MLDEPEVLLPAKGFDARNASMHEDVLGQWIYAGEGSCLQRLVSSGKISEHTQHSIQEQARAPAL